MSTINAMILAFCALNKPKYSFSLVVSEVVVAVESLVATLVISINIKA
jgi:hypothetical protein